jgi:phage gp29-like protein
LPGAKPKKPGEKPEFAAANFPDQTALDNALDELDNARGFDAMDGALKPVFEFLEAHGPHALMLRFSEFYPLPMQQLQDRLARVIFIAEIWGRINGRD